jgi:hypothetical protein
VASDAAIWASALSSVSRASSPIDPVAVEEESDGMSLEPGETRVPLV